MPTGSIRDVSDELKCPAGHTGPFRYVEAIEVWREVQTATTDEVVVLADWQTGEGYNEGVPDSGYLMCWAHAEGGGHCVQQFPVPDGVEPEFVT